MASRFEIVEMEHIEVLKDKSENENTKNGTEYWKNISIKWTNERNFQANLKEYEIDVLVIIISASENTRDKPYSCQLLNYWSPLHIVSPFPEC